MMPFGWWTKRPDSFSKIQSRGAPYWMSALDALARARASLPGVLFTSLSEYDTMDGKKVPVWFTPNESRPLLAFAGLLTR
jgi:hypothetical protein